MHRRAALDIAAITGSILARTSNCQNSEVRRDTRQSERKRSESRALQNDAIPARASESEASRERSKTTRYPPERATANTLRGSHQSEQVAKQVASAPKRKTPDRSRGRREGKGLVRRSLATRLSNNVHPIRESANPCGNFSWNSPINLREPQKTTRGVRREASTSATKRPRQGIGSPETPERGRGAEPNFRLE